MINAPTETIIRPKNHLFVSSLGRIAFIQGFCFCLGLPLQLPAFDLDRSTSGPIVGVLQAAHLGPDHLQIGWWGHANLDFIHGYCKINIYIKKFPKGQ
jgi:hypothetical protein